MTREEQIQDAASDHRDWVCCGFYDPVADAREESFIEGAEWADEHPKEGMVNKQEFIEKAKEWLENTLYIHTEIKNDRDFNEICRTDWVTSDYDSVEDFINSFCKAMEE